MLIYILSNNVISRRANMHQVKILHCADIHIGAMVSYLGSVAAKRRAEVLLTFEKILDTARKETAELVLIAGDLFDSNRISSELIDQAFEAIGTLFPIPVVIAAGNHDPLTADSPYLTRKLPENLFVLGGEDGMIELERLGVRVYGRSFTGVYMRGSSAFSITPPDDELINIMVLHGDTAGEPSSDYNGITKEFIASSGMDYIALGHIHKRSDIMTLGGTHFAYSGCPEGLGFDELGEKGVYIGNIGKGTCELEFVPLCRRKHLELSVDITGLAPSEISDHILRKLREQEDYTDQLYKLLLTGSVPEGAVIPLNEIESRLSDEVYFIKLRDCTTVKADLEAISRERSLKGIFVRKMLERLDSPTTPEQHEILELALDIGLRAFYSEVKYREDN